MSKKENTTTWLSSIDLPETLSPLKRDTACDVVIIGGGITGNLSAYFLAKAGKDVVVLEQKDLKNTVTAYTTAWISCVIDTDLSSLANMYGRNGARRIWDSGLEAIRDIEKIIKGENISCEFKKVSDFSYATSESEMETLKEEAKIAKDLGFEVAVHPKDKLPFKNLGSIEVKNQAKFHPLKFIVGVREKAIKYGVKYFENTKALSIYGKERIEIKTSEGSVFAKYAIVATYNPFNEPKELFAHKGMYISYINEIEIEKNILEEGMYEDNKSPYHYFRVDKGMGESGRDRVILGGEDHRKELPISKEKNFKALKEYFQNLFPNAKFEITKKWTGPILETIDGLPYIGVYDKEHPNRLVATGFSGNGMTYSAISARILSDLILGNNNPYAGIYTPLRKTKPYNFMTKFRDYALVLFGGYVKNIFK